MAVQDEGYRLVFAAASEIGPVRGENQDSFGIFPADAHQHNDRGKLFMVADGMGGLERGSEASRMAVQTVQQSYFSSTTQVRTSLQEAIDKANQKIYEISRKNDLKNRMGTTCTILVFLRDMAYLAHVGDSRAFLFRENCLTQLSQDHSLVAEMLSRGMITAEAAHNHPERSVLTRAVGVEPRVDADTPEPIRLQSNDGFLICSDGLSTVTSEEICEILTKKDPQAICQELVARAVQNGSQDNVTVVYIKVVGTAVRAKSEKEASGKKKKWLWGVGLAALILGLVFLGFHYRGSFRKILSSMSSKQVASFDSAMDTESGAAIDELMRRAQNWQTTEQWARALADYHTILKQDPTHIGAIQGINRITADMLARGQQQLLDGRYSAALACFELFQQEYPDNREIADNIIFCQKMMRPGVDSVASAILTPPQAQDSAAWAANTKLAVQPLEDITDFSVDNWDFPVISETAIMYDKTNLEVNQPDVETIITSKSAIKDFHMKMDILFTASGSCGVLLGYDKATEPIRDFFSIQLSEQGKYSFRKIEKLSSKVLFSGTAPESRTIRGEFNLDIKCFGPYILFSINDRLGGSLENRTVITGKIGLWISGKTRVRFSNIEIVSILRD